MRLEMEANMGLLDESEMSEDEQKAILLDGLESREREALEAAESLSTMCSELSETSFGLPFDDDINETMRSNLQWLQQEEEWFKQ